MTAVTVRGGDAEVTGGGQASTLHARESVQFAGAADNFTSRLAPARPPDDFEFWCQERDRREEQSQSVRHVSREMIGYEDLDANGVWREVPAYSWGRGPPGKPGVAPPPRGTGRRSRHGG